VDTIRTAFKEKYLGRKEGAKRGELEVDYNPATLSLIMSAVMIGVLIYINK